MNPWNTFRKLQGQKACSEIISSKEYPWTILHKFGIVSSIIWPIKCKKQKKQKKENCHGLSGGSLGFFCVLLCFSPVCLPPTFLPSPASVYRHLDLWMCQLYRLQRRGAPVFHSSSPCYLSPVMSPLQRQIVPPVMVTKSRLQAILLVFLRPYQKFIFLHSTE